MLQYSHFIGSCLGNSFLKLRKKHILKHLISPHVLLSVVIKTHNLKATDIERGMVLYACNLGTWDTEAEI